jgi:2-C-methyl-D-erythritol 4-phosphate cytidylyltransferase
MSTIRKKNAWSIQTPQAFRWHDLLAVHKSAAIKKTVNEDDASMLEELGYKIKMVEGEEENIKITTPIDLFLAELIVRHNIELRI